MVFTKNLSNKSSKRLFEYLNIYQNLTVARNADKVLQVKMDKMKGGNKKERERKNSFGPTLSSLIVEEEILSSYSTGHVALPSLPW